MKRFDRNNHTLTDDLESIEQLQQSHDASTDASTITRLLKLFKDCSFWAVRWKAADVLGRIGHPSVEALLKLLENDELKSRFKIIEALGNIRHPRAVAPLIKELEHTDWNVRRYTAHALGKIGDPRAINPLCQHLRDPDDTVREEILFALGQVFDRVHTVSFGQSDATNVLDGQTWINPDVVELTLPLPRLEQIDIHIATYQFHLVEQFITYAVNQIGQTHLRKRVNVRLFGKAEHFHYNLQNALTHLCKSVRMYETYTAP